MKTTATVNENGILLSGLCNKYINLINGNEVLTEQEINNIKNFINNKASNEERGLILGLIADKGFLLSAEHNRKGIEFMKGKLYTPKGKERKGHVFGYREIDAINTFEQFLFIGLYDIARYGQRGFYVPIYRLMGKEACFDYYYNGEVNIIG